MHLSFDIRSCLLSAAAIAMSACDTGTTTKNVDSETPPTVSNQSEPGVDTYQEPVFDASLFGLGPKARRIRSDEKTDSFWVTDDGIVLTSNAGKPAVFSLVETFPASIGQSFDVKMEFDLEEAGEDTTPMILVWALDADGEFLDQQAFTSSFSRRTGIGAGEKTLSVRFDTVEIGSGNPVIRRADEAASLRFVASPIHASAGARAVLTDFTVTPVTP